MSKTVSDMLEYCTRRQLDDIATDYNIDYTKYRTRDLLIEAIRKYREDNGK